MSPPASAFRVKDFVCRRHRAGVGGALILFVSSCCVAALFGSRAASAGSAPGRLVPLDEVAPKVELAPPMGELQRLTHKLSLAVGGRNLELTAFYAYESLELLREIQREIPEYDGQPIALLIDRMAMPAYDALTRALEARRAGDRRAGGGDDAESVVEAAGRGVAGVVAACNDCHRATSHAFIRITDERERNPFNQEFDQR